MPKAFDGTIVSETLPRMKCGGVPMWDYQSECGYICSDCFSVIGSIGQPEQCKQINNSNLEFDPVAEAWNLYGGLYAPDADNTLPQDDEI